MREYLSLAQLGKIEGVKGDTIKRRIYRGKYRKVRRTEPGRGGKKSWEISIYDPAIPQEVRDLYERQATNFFGLPKIEDIQRLSALVGSILEELRIDNECRNKELKILKKNTALLERLIRKFK